VNAMRLELKGMRLNNIYDINPKTYLLKFSQPDRKTFLVIESGIRVHLTTFSHEKNEVPSVFTMKIRRHCRTRRLESVRQLGLDRIIHFTFGTGESAFHLVVELYAK
jgi:predicted ribosome quality control (RQC) complex YloA/Tae2 family protein